RAVALRAPAAEDRLGPPAGLVALRRRGCEAPGDEVLAVTAKACERLADTGREHERRRVEVALDLRVAVVLEPHVHAARARLEPQLREVQLLDGSLEPEPGPAAVGSGKRQIERRRGEEPVLPARLAVADDTDHGALRRGALGPEDAARAGREERAEARARRMEAVRPRRD